MFIRNLIQLYLFLYLFTNSCKSVYLPNIIGQPCLNVFSVVGKPIWTKLSMITDLTLCILAGPYLLYLQKLSNETQFS